MTMANIVINDGKTTPVSHTFQPQQGQVGKLNASWFERTAMSSQAWPRIDTRVDLVTRPQDGDHAMRTSLHVPVVVLDESGAEVLKGVRRYYVTAVVPYGLNAVEGLQSDFGLLKNLLANSQVLSVFKDQVPSS